MTEPQEPYDTCQQKGKRENCPMGLTGEFLAVGTHGGLPNIPDDAIPPAPPMKQPGSRGKLNVDERIAAALEGIWQEMKRANDQLATFDRSLNVTLWPSETWHTGTHQTCPHCGGTGQGDGSSTMCCYCGGSGRVPA